MTEEVPQTVETTFSRLGRYELVPVRSAAIQSIAIFRPTGSGRGFVVGCVDIGKNGVPGMVAFGRCLRWGGLFTAVEFLGQVMESHARLAARGWAIASAAAPAAAVLRRHSHIAAVIDPEGIRNTVIEVLTALAIGGVMRDDATPDETIRHALRSHLSLPQGDIEGMAATLCDPRYGLRLNLCLDHAINEAGFAEASMAAIFPGIAAVLSAPDVVRSLGLQSADRTAA